MKKKYRNRAEIYASVLQDAAIEITKRINIKLGQQDGMSPKEADVRRI